jgi:hypothetical protein
MATLPGRSGHDGTKVIFLYLGCEGRNEPIRQKKGLRFDLKELTKTRFAENQIYRLSTNQHSLSSNYRTTTTMKFSNSIHTIFFVVVLALLGTATPSAAATTMTTAADMTTAETTEPAAVVGGLRGGTAQEHRSLYCSPTTYIYCMSKCRSRIYKSIAQCFSENPACAQPGCT